MQRQSLGSPSSKVVKDEQQVASQPSPSSASSILYGQECFKEEELIEKLNPKTTKPQTYIHIIPLLTLLCFLILYLSSYDPSLNDLAEFNGVKTISNPAELHENISELQGILEVKKGDILAIRSLKTFKQRRLHRKIAHF